MEINCVACGKDHIIIMSTDGRIYGCGDNQYGQLGLGHNIRVRDMEQIIIGEKRFSQVATGSYHSGLLTNSGELYMCGCGTYGRLGLGDQDHRNYPEKVIFNCKGYDPNRVIIQQIACGDQHTLACIREIGPQKYI